MGVSLDADGDNFILRAVAEDGSETTAVLSSDDVLALANSAPSFRQSIMSRRHAGAVFVTPVSRTAVTWDALGENLLVQLGFGSSGSAVYELSPDNSRILAETILSLLEQAPDAQSPAH